MNFSLSFSGPKKLTSPHAQDGHSALTLYFLLDMALQPPAYLSLWSLPVSPHSGM
jgi:hypothetical protein